MGNLGGQTHAELLASKSHYQETVLQSGETPAMQLPGGVLSESDILCEYIDAVSTTGQRLLPSDPFLASRIKLSIRKFNTVPPAIVKLLKNQDPSADSEMVATVDAAVDAFAKTLDEGAEWCHGSTCSLADVHCGPFLYRFQHVLAHWRGFDLLGRHPRMAKIMNALEGLTAWQHVLDPSDKLYPRVTPDLLVRFYEQYANNNLWGTGPNNSRVLVGRGASAR